MTYEERERGPSQSREEPRGRRVFLSCRVLQKHGTVTAVREFLEREGCIVSTTGNVEGTGTSAEAAIEQSDVFICVMD
jgi:hypothetical protein